MKKYFIVPGNFANQYSLFWTTDAGMYPDAANAEALKAWGEWSVKPVIMPDGEEVIPAYFFGHENIYNVFIPWACVQGEKWPGEV